MAIVIALALTISLIERLKDKEGDHGVNFFCGEV